MIDFFSTLDGSLLPELLCYHEEAPMIFSSGLFFVLFILFLPIYGLLGLSKRTATLRIIYVVLFSLFFYYKSSGFYVLLLLLATTSDFLIAQALSHTPQGSPNRKRWVALSMIINLGILSYFKYFNFLLDLIVQAIAGIGGLMGMETASSLQWEPWDIFLPVGISFYTFQTMSYIADVYRGDIKPLKRWIDYLFYVSFFPQLVAGPIVRAKDFIPQIHRRPWVTRGEFGRGLFLILLGLFKKAVISDYISLNFVDRIFDAPTLYSGLENLMAVYGYALQIYCDFSGYSDMAIGIALFLGFRFNKNFDVPYTSTNITEFWRRWHISLSTWLKDYLYIPLGGNRKGRIRTYINLIITMLLGGLWHGAALRFILWGGMHGIALAIHKVWCALFYPAHKRRIKRNGIGKAIGGIITFHFVCFAWIFFRADSIDVVEQVLTQITSNFHPEIILDFVTGYHWVLLLMLIGYVLHYLPFSQRRAAERALTRAPFWVQTLLLTALIFLVFQMKSADVQPFIYFQF